MRSDAPDVPVTGAVSGRRVALLMIGDGRDRLRHATMFSLYDAAHGEAIAFQVEVDDRAHRLGFAGAIREGWARLRELPGWDYVLHVEEDWQFDRPFALDRMIDLLECDPRLAQVALRRGPVNDVERAAGGVVEMWPEEYEDGVLFDPALPECPFLRHRLYFTTNPCVYPRSLIEEIDWPQTAGSERAFSEELARRGRTFALWGARHGGPWITHTGERARGARGY